MATENVKLPTWAWWIIGVVLVGSVSLLSSRALGALDANTEAISVLTVKLTEVKSSVDLVRSDTQGTLSRLLDKVDAQGKEIEQLKAEVRELRRGR